MGNQTLIPCRIRLGTIIIFYSALACYNYCWCTEQALESMMTFLITSIQSGVVLMAGHLRLIHFHSVDAVEMAGQNKLLLMTERFFCVAMASSALHICACVSLQPFPDKTAFVTRRVQLLRGNWGGRSVRVKLTENTLQ